MKFVSAVGTPLGVAAPNFRSRTDDLKLFTQLGIGTWWDESHDVFFVDFAEGGITLMYSKQPPHICGQARWNSMVGHPGDFDDPVLPFGLSWEMSPADVRNVLGRPSNKRFLPRVGWLERAALNYDELNYKYLNLCDAKVEISFRYGRFASLFVSPKSRFGR